MATTPRRSEGVQSKTCDHFLSAVAKDSYNLCVVCKGQRCSSELRHEHCLDWSPDRWARVQIYQSFLALQMEKKKERKVQPKSSSSFSVFSIPMWICNSSKPDPSGFQKVMSPSIIVLSFHDVIITSTSSKSNATITTRSFSSPVFTILCVIDVRLRCFRA